MRNVLQFVCGAECGAVCVAEFEPEACRRDLARFCWARAFRLFHWARLCRYGGGTDGPGPRIPAK